MVSPLRNHDVNTSLILMGAWLQIIDSSEPTWLKNRVQQVGELSDRARHNVIPNKETIIIIAMEKCFFLTRAF
jgi:hypothetical protein